MMGESREQMTKKAKGQGASGSAKAPAEKGGFSLISNEKLIKLYATMLQCRTMDERLRADSGTKGRAKAAAGQEATAVGVAIDLLAEDTLHAAEQAHLFSFMRGVPLNRVAGPAKGGLRKSAADVKSAMAAAEVHKANGNGRVAVLFSSRESVPAAEWDEALKSAGAGKLPVLFVCYGGGDEERASAEEQAGARGVALRTQSYGFAEIAVDASDVVAVYRVASEAITHARKGNGPTLIECTPYRLMGGSPAAGGNGGGTGGGGGWDDPILKMEQYLAGKGLFRKQLKAGIAARFRKDLDAKVGAGGKSPVV